MKKIATLLAVAVVALVAAPALADLAPPRLVTPRPRPAPDRPVAPKRPLVQVAILLDTSNSMDGLIGQAKTELWRIVNEIASYRRNGADPLVQVALYEYGNTSLPAEQGYLRLVSPLTSDLDAISEALFNLTTNGGDEYCGLAIHRATADLAWSTNPDDYRAIFIAGNEPFTQGKTDYRTAVAEATRKGIYVNTIHCGSLDEGVSGGWRDGADRGRGNYMAIDQGDRQVHVATPYDAEIAALGEKLNGTYVGYGRGGRGKAMKERQEAQDRNSEKAGGSAAVERSVAKGKKGVYSNESWDMVDAKKQGKIKAAAAVPEEELPDEMKKMSPAQREAYLDQKAKDREEIQKKIEDLSAKRTKFLADAAAKGAKDKDGTFDGAMRKALKGQMTQKKFESKQP
jgi:hypothetical protein